MYAKTNPFYLSKEWRKLRLEVLVKHKFECQECKKRGKYSRATHVHHIMHFDEHPEYGLSEYVTLPNGTKKKNLIPVCRECHETVCHPERLRWNKKEQLNKERW